MFFQRNMRIKTESKIAESLQNTFYDSKRRAKIKNTRFSLGHQFDKAIHLDSKLQRNEKKESEPEKEDNLQQKKSIFLKKLPELNFQNRQYEKEAKQVTKQLKQVTVQGKKKQVMLNSILEILKPTSNWYSNGGITRKLVARLPGDQRADAEFKQYRNQFSEEISHYSSTKHHRTPKILENDLMKFKNSNKIVRRKIFSEDKSRQKQEKEHSESKQAEDSRAKHPAEYSKAHLDLQKIQIITFSSKFPIFKKDSSHLK